MPNDHTIKVICVGEVKLASRMVLKDVLHVVKFRYNMLLGAKMAKDCDMRVVFYDKSYFLQDYVTHQARGIKGKKGLYYLLNLSQPEIKLYEQAQRKKRNVK